MDVYIMRTTARDTPFFVYFNHSLMHLPVISRALHRSTRYLTATAPWTSASRSKYSSSCERRSSDGRVEH